MPFDLAKQLSEAQKKGIKQGKQAMQQEIARRMLKEQYNIQEIAFLVGLPQEQIELLRTGNLFARH